MRTSVLAATTPPMPLQSPYGPWRIMRQEHAPWAWPGPPDRRVDRGVLMSGSPWPLSVLAVESVMPCRYQAEVARFVAIISTVHIESSAPTRIDLAGGTLDIWPLYLFHERAQTINAAISLRARCSIQPRGSRGLTDRVRRHGAASGRHALERAPGQSRVAAARSAAPLLSSRRPRAPYAFRIAGWSRHRRIVGAQHRRVRRADGLDRPAPHRRRHHADRDERRGAGHRRADRRAGLSTGALRRHLGGGARRRRRAPCGAARRGARARTPPRAGLHRRDEELGDQQLGSHQAPHRRRPRRAAALRPNPRHRRRHARARSSEARGPKSGAQIAEEWENRKGLAPGVTTPEIDAILAAARDAGAYGGKVCGAGGGGCLFCLGEPERIPAIREAIAARGGRLLDFTIESEGLRVDTRVTV